MGVTTYKDEYSSPIAPGRIFKACIVDSHNLIPKLIPQIKSIEFTQGSGGPGSIKQINFADGSPFKTLKYHIEELNEETLTYKYTLIEGESFHKDVEKIAYDVKIEANSNGGSISKVTTNYFTKSGLELNEDEIKGSKEKIVGFYKALEDYLVQNPNAYAQAN